LTATAVSPIQIDLSWNYPDKDGGTAVAGYRIDVKVGTGNYLTLEQDTDSSSRAYSHLELITDTQYSYKVYAINPTGTSGPSNEASATPSTSSAPAQSKEKPGPPRSLIVTPFSPTQINLSWQPPSNDGGSSITGYKVEVKKGIGNYETLNSNVGKNTKYPHTGLATGTNYEYRVYSINSIGTSTSFVTASGTPQPEKTEPVSTVPDFVDPKQGAQYYLDRYNNEIAYKEWFDTNFPDYTIEEAIELAIPGTFTEDKSEKPILSFVDTTRDPQYYIERYTNEPTYKEWFDETFPDYTIYEAVGIEETEVQIGTCGPGTILVNGYCEAEKQSGGGCLIATAAFGSEISPQIQSLRELRDNSLLQTNSGQTFMTGFNEFYYTFSPTIADWERQNPIFKESVKITITPLLASLSLLNHVDMDSEKNVLTYGIGIILLNVGMYFIMPTVAIFTITRHVINKTT
jgi:titin